MSIGPIAEAAARAAAPFIVQLIAEIAQAFALPHDDVKCFACQRYPWLKDAANRYDEAKAAALRGPKG